ncbi:MAG: hypothetical protein JOY70_02375 [Acidisphaera sp.]|nr:hypothetical protein [Acidisphaera sp.]
MGVGVRGQIAGGKLAISYDEVYVRPALLAVDTGGEAKKAAQASLGVSASLPVRSPFGS